MECVYCERTLICAGCQTRHVPVTAEQYAALSRPEVAIRCAECGQVLVCQWCKTPYDGSDDDVEE